MIHNYEYFNTLIMQLVMIKYVCINEKHYLNENFNVLINVIMQFGLNI